VARPGDRFQELYRESDHGYHPWALAAEMASSTDREPELCRQQNVPQRERRVETGDQQEADQDAAQSVGRESGELATQVSAHPQEERPEEWLALEPPEQVSMGPPQAQQPERPAWQPPGLVLGEVSRLQVEPQA